MFKHILLPLDGSHLAERALPAALELARCFDSKITLLRVAQAPHKVTGVAGQTIAELVESFREEARREAAEYLKAQKGSLRQQGYNVHSYMSDGEPVAQYILDAADSLDVDVIVMSTHGWGGIWRWVYGSVADRVLRYAKVPVLLIRAREGIEVTIPPIEDEAAMRAHEEV